MGPGPGPGLGPAGMGGGGGGGEGGYHMHQPQTGPLPQGQPMNPMVPVMYGGGMQGGPELYDFQSVGWDPLEVGCNCWVDCGWW